MDDVERVGQEGRVAADEKPSFERIVAEHGSFVRRTLAQLGVPTRCLADVEQEVYRGVHRGLPTFDPALAPQPEGAVRSWLFGICERQAASQRRSEMRRSEVLVTVDDLDTAQDVPDTEESLIEAERKALLHRLLDTLEPRRRAVVVAYELEGIPMTEVAAAVGIPVNTAWNRLRLAREDLRTAWGRLAAQRGMPGVSARSAAIAPLALILGPSAFRGDGAAPSWLSLPVIKLPVAVSTVLGATVGTAGVALGVLALRPSSPPPAGPHDVRQPPPRAVALAAAGPEAPVVVVPPVESASLVPAPEGTGAAPPPSAEGSAVDSGGRSPSAAPRHAAAGSASSSVDFNLKKEVAQLTAAANAFDTGDTQGALEILESHERVYPDGRMIGQREVLRVRALMAEGRRNEARDCARAFLGAHPKSPDRTSIEAVVGKVD